jgi:hypothetical protein
MPVIEDVDHAGQAAKNAPNASKTERPGDRCLHAATQLNNSLETRTRF